MARPIDLMFPPEFKLLELPGGLSISRRVGFSERRNEMTLPISRIEFELWQAGGQYVQDAFPDLSVDQREFLLSGMNPEDWAAMCSGEEE